MSNDDFDIAAMSNLHTQNTDNSLLPSTSTFTNDWPESLLELDFIKTEPPDTEEITFEPRIVTVTNFQAAEDEEDDADKSINDLTRIIKNEPTDENDYTDDYSSNYQVEKSLFTVTSSKRRLPWEEDVDAAYYDDCKDNDNIEPMGAYEESEILHKLKLIISSDDQHEQSLVPVWIKRFYRKLCVRQIKRKFGKSIFDIDNIITGDRRNGLRRHNEVQVLDRYHHLICSSNTNSFQSKLNESENMPSFHARLAGSIQYDLFESPHTHRILHPFIYRNTKTFPPWLKVRCLILLILYLLFYIS